MAITWFPNMANFPAMEMQPEVASTGEGSAFPLPGPPSQDDPPNASRTSETDPGAGSSVEKTQSQPPPSKRLRISSSLKPATLCRNHKCSTCDQAFNRAEHLIRHERSHRKERPFSCDYCDALFTRKDLIKRHMTRMHQDILASEDLTNLTSNPPRSNASADPHSSSNLGPVPTVTGVAGTAPSSDSPTPLPQPASSMQDGPTSSRSEMHRSVDLQPQIHTQPTQYLMQLPQTEDVVQLPQGLMQQPQDIIQPFTIHSPNSLFDLDAFLNEMSPFFARPFGQQGMPVDFGNEDGFAPNIFSDVQLDGHHQESQGHTLNPAIPLGANSSTASEVTEDSPSSRISDPMISSRTIPHPQQTLWKGSFELSEAKRADLIADMKQVFCLARVDVTFKMPSCFALERFITAFFDAFLIHMPCIHIPSWQAEAAHPSLLLAMIALGANFQYEKELAHSLHRAARLSIINYLELSNFTSKKRPAWVMQALFFTMAFGTWSGKFDAVQEAFSFQANLAHMVRYVEEPGQRWDKMRDGDTWIEMETVKRTKLVLYSYFNNLTMTFNVPPALLNSEVDLSLPCSEGEWTAPTPEALAEYHKRSPTPTPAFSTVLKSLLSPTVPYSIPCSTFGSYVMIHALLQQIWHIRQVLPNDEDPEELAHLEPALRKWQAVWEADPESSISPRNPHGPLAFNSSALLRLAYVRLRVDFARVKTVVASQYPEAICKSMMMHMGNVKRSPGDTKAALYAIHALRIPVKLGMNLVARSGSLIWSLQHHLYSFECCLFLSKWLEAISAPGAEATWTEDERRVEALIRETLEEADVDSSHREKSMSAKIMHAWALMFDCLEIWGVTSVLGSSFLLYANSIG